MKNKYLGASWIAASVALLAVGGFFIWHTVSKHDRGVSYGAEAGIASSNDSATNTGGTTDSGLKAQESNPDSTSQLSNQGGQNLVDNSNKSSDNSLSWPDPSTFSKYDSYKTSNSTVFADVVKGTGTELTSGHLAAVYYKGFLTNGKIFDQSKPDSSGQVQPFVFKFGAHQVIQGWEDGLAGMKVGGARLLVIPPSQGYGSTGQGSIPPNSVLIFEVQLLQVQ